MSSVLPGTFLPGDSLLHHLDGRAKLASLLLLIAAVLAVTTTPGWAVVTLVVATAVLLSHLPASIIWRAISRIGWFLGFIILLNTLFYGQGETWFEFGVLRPGPGGLAIGASLAARVILIVVASAVFVATTQPLATVSALSWLITPLRLIRVPTWQVALILSVAMQFVPTLFDEARSIRTAQTARGATFDEGGPIARARALLPLLIPLIVAAFRRADELAIAMEARGYRTDGQRTQHAPASWTPRDVVVLVGAAVLCAAAIWLG
jgi:energy-coupling factor transport system permease protein